MNYNAGLAVGKPWPSEATSERESHQGNEKELPDPKKHPGERQCGETSPPTVPLSNSLRDLHAKIDHLMDRQASNEKELHRILKGILERL